MPRERNQKVVGQADVPPPPPTLHTVSWALLDVGTLGYRQTTRHGSNDGLLVWGWAWLSHGHSLLPWYHFLPIIRSTLLGLLGGRAEMSFPNCLWFLWSSGNGQRCKDSVILSRREPFHLGMCRDNLNSQPSLNYPCQNYRTA